MKQTFFASFKILSIAFLSLVVLAACAPTATAPKQPEVILVPKRSMEQDIQRLLRSADEALAADRLTSPEHNNAFDRYRAVLLLKPGHPRAVAGMNSIMQRYLSLARAAMQRNNIDGAKQMLARAGLVNGQHPAFLKLSRQIKEHSRASLAPLEKQQQPVVPENEHRLDPEKLSAKAQDIVELLRKIARQARLSGETLMIVARTDTEGRWIYRMMKQAVPGFRLRGDISIGKQPKVILLPPID